MQLRKIKRLAATGSVLAIGSLTFGATGAVAASTPDPVAHIAMPNAPVSAPRHVTHPAVSDPVAHIAVGPRITRSHTRHHVTRSARSHRLTHRAR